MTPGIARTVIEQVWFDGYTPAMSFPAVITEAATSLISGWRPDPVPRTTPTRLSWGGVDITNAAGELSVSGDELVIACRGPASPELRQRLQGSALRELFGRALEGDLPDGARLQAGQAFISDLVITYEDISFHLHGLDWTISPPSFTPTAWVGLLQGGFDLGLGNLTVDVDNPTETHWSAGHLLLSGAYRYWLIQTGQRFPATWHVVVECEGVPDRSKLAADFRLIQFAVGRRLRLDWLAGLECVPGRSAFVGMGLGAVHPQRARKQEPVPLGSHAAWVVPFFEALSASDRNNPELALFVPVSNYLDALTDNLDSAYLKLQVGLEALAHAVVRREAKGSSKRIVADWEGWLRFVESQRPFVQSIALPDYEETIIGKMRSAGLAPTGEVVETAFARFGMNLLPEMGDELRGRNLPAHHGVMSKPDDRDYARDSRRIALVRTMLVGLLAKVVGYDGPIVGWERDPGMAYRDADDSWWTIGGIARPRAEKFWVIPDEPPAAPT